MATAATQKAKFQKLIGQRIKEVRKKKGISIRHFEAMDEGFDRHLLSRYERGLKMPTVFIIYKICRVCKISLQDFYKGIE